MPGKSEQINLKITQELLDKYPIQDDLTPSQFIKTYWDYYTDDYPKNNSTNGTILENLVIIALAREGIKDIYYQTELSYVPSAKFDAFLFNEKTPVALSIKTSLRERWKQADLEAMALKQVHKEAMCYLLTLSEKEVLARRKPGAIYSGLDGFILLDTSEFDDLVDKLKMMEFTIAGDVPIITTADKKYTDIILKNNFHFI